MADHLLSCICGEDVSVNSSMAGLLVKCRCGKELTVPSMREISLLPIREVNSGRGYRDPGASEARAYYVPVLGGAVGLAIASLNPGFAVIVCGVSWLIWYTAKFWIAGIAAREMNRLVGVAVFFVPALAVLFALTHWKAAKRPAVTAIVAMVCCFVSLGLAIKDMKPANPDERSSWSEPVSAF